MSKQKKKFGMLTAAMLLTLSSLAYPQAVQANETISQEGSTELWTGTTEGRVDNGTFERGPDKTGDEGSVIDLGTYLTEVELFGYPRDVVKVSQLHQLNNEVNKVAAGSAALAALHPENFDPNDKFSVALGFGHYRNANAGAIGAFYKPNYDTTISMGATVGKGEPLMNMGVSFKLGNHGKTAGYQTNEAEALSQEIASLRKSNDKLTQDNKALSKKVEGLEADNERMKEQIAKILAKIEMN